MNTKFWFATAGAGMKQDLWQKMKVPESLNLKENGGQYR